MRKESSEGSETEAQHHLPWEGERKTYGHTPPHYVGKEAWQEVEIRATGSEPLSKHGETMLQSSGVQLWLQVRITRMWGVFVSFSICFYLKKKKKHQQKTDAGTPLDQL